MGLWNSCQHLAKSFVYWYFIGTLLVSCECVNLESNAVLILQCKSSYVSKMSLTRSGI